MTLRALGRSDVMIAPLVLGCNVFGWTVDHANAFTILDAYIDAGFNAIDTADVYSAWVPGHTGGESETVIGNWLKARGGRDRIVIASKVGEEMPHVGRGLSPEHIVRSVEASLRRLQTDYVDLYQSHLDDEPVPFEITLEAYDRLKRAGKIRACGASHHSPARLGQALAVSEDRKLIRYDAVQPRFNLFDQEEYAGALQQLCVEQDVGALCYSALAKGFLTGRYRPGQERAMGIWDKLVQARYLNDRGFRILDAIDVVATEQRAPAAAIALAWVGHQPGVVAPVISVESLEQLNDLLGFHRLRLTSDQISRLDNAATESPAE